MPNYNELIHALADQVGVPPSAIHEAVQQAVDTYKADDADEQRSRINRLRLLELEASLRIHHELEPGDLVCWKDGLRNKRRPADGEAAVVVARLADPVFDSEEGAGSAYFREPLDLIVGLLDEDGDFVHYHVDQRRMQPYGQG